MMKKFALCAVAVAGFPVFSVGETAPAEVKDPALDEGWKIKEIRKIWDAADHNAFTDLIRYRDYWYCTFREASAHRSQDGRQRVIRSKDGLEWESVACMTGEKPNHDIRDPKLSVTPSGELMLNGFVAYRGEEGEPRESLTWFSADGTHWSESYHCPTGANTWRWRARWHDGKVYSLAYNGKDVAGTFYSSADGKTWEKLTGNVFPVTESPKAKDGKAYCNESDLHFEPDGNVIALVRRDVISDDKKWQFSADAEGTSGLLGFSKPPYQEWTWKDLGVRIGGPVLLKLSDGRFVAAVRLYEQPRHTALLVIDPAKGEATKVLRFPTGGDTGYAGMAEYEGELWVSYYSSHEGKSSIYLAKVAIPALGK